MNLIKLSLIFSSLIFTNLIYAEEANQEFAWGTSRKEILTKIKIEPDSQDNEVITYTNQLVIDNNADISYLFYKDKLWRKIVQFTFYDDNKLKELKNLLSSKYGDSTESSGYASWKKDDISIWIDLHKMELLEIPVSIVKLIYEDEKTANLYFEEKQKEKESEL